ETEKASAGGAESGTGASAPAKERRVVLIGDADFASNAYLDMSGNSDLFLNAVGWLAQAGDLISIRPRDNRPQPVTLTAARANVLSAMTYLTPLVALIGAVLVWTQRKSL
ncbi:MAG TPA: hypothetical protein VNI57_15435, partial [Candidatus Saccharimonadales bacterium]|nr:hypothetical protein [Candidatus Saccharimonadales bacterium]